MDTKEKIIEKCKPHWITYIIPALICALFLIMAMGYLFQLKTGDFVACLIIAAIFAFITYIKSLSSLELSENYVVGKIGFIKTKKLASPIGKVQDVSVSSGLFGKIFGYSTICVSTAGSHGAEYTFKKMKNGEVFQAKFLELLK